VSRLEDDRTVMPRSGSPPQRVLVAGGFGFIGSHLVEQLLDDGHEVVVVDDLSSSPLPLADLLAELGDHAGLRHVEGDITEVAADGDLGAVDEIYHLASFVGPAGILSHGGRIARQLVGAASAVAALAQRRGARLVFVSSSEVYGGGRDGLCPEDAPRVVAAGTSVRREYAAAKIAAEVLLGNLGPQGLDVRIVRPFNVAGPRQSGRGGFVLPRFIGQAMSGDDLTVFGDGSQLRAFSDVGEIAAGLRATMRVGRPGETYNLGNVANRTTILDLARLVLDVTGSDSGIVFVDGKAIYGPLYEEAHDKVPDARRAAEELGWRPRRTCRDIAESTADYMRRLRPELLHRLSGHVATGSTS
jgi:UDP-glucose 4-epimerase